jgi:hypothetical protein
LTRATARRKRAAAAGATLSVMDADIKISDAVSFREVVKVHATMEGFVALIDVLGFKSRILGDSKGESLERYLDRVREALPPDSGFDFVVFSDTIFITTGGDSEASLQGLVQRCSLLFHLLLLEHIPIRGAIAHGSYFRWSHSDTGAFVAGKAILDAYEYEKKQDWLGIMLAPSALRCVPDLLKRCSVPIYAERKADDPYLPWAAFVQHYSIPFHGTEGRYDGFAVVPTDGIAEPGALRDSLSASVQQMHWLKSLAPDPAAQAKYSPSIELAANASNQRGYVAEHWARNLPKRPEPDGDDV